MATNDHGRNWCHDHSHGERGIWQYCCAQVWACQMNVWLRRHSNVLPTLSQVNAQRVLWQKRCDRLLDEVLCNQCIDDKDDAFAEGKGLDCIPDNCSECRTVRRIFEQTVMLMTNRTPCGLGIPCPEKAIINSDFIPFSQTIPLTIYTGGAKGVDTHVEHLCHKYGHSCVVFIPPCHPRAKSLAPLTKPYLDAAMPIVTRAAFQLGLHVSHPITLKYLQRNYHVIKPASLVLDLGYFDELRNHVLGGTGWSVAMAQLLLKPLYAFDLDMEQWYWWNSTLHIYQPCEGMTEEEIGLPTSEAKTAIVGIREEDAAVYPTLDALFQRS